MCWQCLTSYVLMTTYTLKWEARSSWKTPAKIISWQNAVILWLSTEPAQTYGLHVLGWSWNFLLGIPPYVGHYSMPPGELRRAERIRGPFISQKLHRYQKRRERLPAFFWNQEMLITGSVRRSGYFSWHISSRRKAEFLHQFLVVHIINRRQSLTKSCLKARVKEGSKWKEILCETIWTESERGVEPWDAGTESTEHILQGATSNCKPGQWAGQLAALPSHKGVGQQQCCSSSYRN